MSQGLPRDLLALRISKELRAGQVVNLGIGLPTLVSQFLDPGLNIVLHAENGILGYGAPHEDDPQDANLINAGGEQVSIQPGAAFFDSAQSFAMVRGGHIDVSVLGGLQVSATGDLANWYVPERGGGSIGGAMDLAVGARRLIIAMEHTTRDGQPRILKRCTYPLTGVGCVDLIVTNLAVMEVRPEGLLLTEIAPGFRAEEVLSATDAPVLVSPNLRMMLED
jgi:3-oxoacid CoA-transferase B subunit